MHFLHIDNYLSIAKATLCLYSSDDLQLSKVNLKPLSNPFGNLWLWTPCTTIGLSADSENQNNENKLELFRLKSIKSVKGNSACKCV